MSHITYEQAGDRLAARLLSPRRTILGIIGPPGAGKSTLASRLQTHFGEDAQVLPMDGFHLADSELQRLGMHDRKGAPDTFDSIGYTALLRRIRTQTPNEPIIYAPDFDRSIEASLAGSRPIFGHTRLILAEGNYLALDRDGWEGVASLLDEIWYVDIDPALRLERLLARHVEFGRSPEQAVQWEQQTDRPNARLIESCKAKAQFLVSPGNT